jgi:hypothetical protein
MSGLGETALDGICLSGNRGWINKVASASAQHRHGPLGGWLTHLWTSLNVSFHPSANQFCHGPIPLRGDFFEPLEEWLWQLNLSSSHAINVMSAAELRQGLH